VLWIATKISTASCARNCKQSPRHVVPLSNGVDHVEVLRKRFGKESVIPATIAVEAERALRRICSALSIRPVESHQQRRALLGTIVEKLRKLGFTANSCK